MTGIEMMLKSMGIDPEQIKAGLIQAQQSIIGEVKSLHEKLASIDTKITRIEMKLQTMPDKEVMKLLADNELEVQEEIRKNGGDYSN